MRVPGLLPHRSARAFRILFFLKICIKKYQKVGGQNGQQQRADPGATNTPAQPRPLFCEVLKPLPKREALAEARELLRLIVRWWSRFAHRGPA